VRSTQFIEQNFAYNKGYYERNQADSEVAQDETTESVFSRKDRKAYRAEVLGRSAKTSKRVTKRKASAVGEEKQTRSKARRETRPGKGVHKRLLLICSE
jgi:hypothetical protein